MSKAIDNKTIFDTSKQCTQIDFAKLVGISEGAVRKSISKKILDKESPLGDWLIDYCSNLREQAAGRSTKGDLDLATERAGLAREQKLRIEYQNAVTRKEYGPISQLEIGLSEMMVRAASKLDSIPAKLKITSNKLTAEDLDVVTEIIATIRNEISESAIDWFMEHIEDDGTLD